MIAGRKNIILMMVICCIHSSLGYYGEYVSAVPSLNLPLGAREIAMGDVGVTIARSEVGAYWNPALMGVRDIHLQYGTLYYGFGKPNLRIYDPGRFEKTNDQNHVFSLSYQFPRNSAGGFNLSVNHHTEKRQGWWADSKKDNFETIYSFTWGFGFQEIGIENHTFGVTVKYFHSVLPAGFYDDDSDGIGNGLAFDFGYLWKIGNHFSAGLHFANIGSPVFYVSRAQMDPIPFKGEIGIGFQDGTTIANVPVSISAEYKVSRFFVKNNFDGRPDPFYQALSTSWKGNSSQENWRSILHNFGYEITLYNYFHLRQGFCIDPRTTSFLGDEHGEREMHWGFGGTFLNHFSIDFYHIYSPKTTYLKHNAWGLTGTFFNIGKWSNL
jgi:hypothetical protein